MHELLQPESHTGHAAHYRGEMMRTVACGHAGTLPPASSRTTKPLKVADGRALMGQLAETPSPVYL